MQRAATKTPADRPSLVEILEELADLSAGLGILLLPLLILAAPGLILFVVLPGLLLLAVPAVAAAIGAAIIAPPYLLLRAVRRRMGRSRLRHAPRETIAHRI
jgi:Flp pilus assembly protein TadB